MRISLKVVKKEVAKYCYPQSTQLSGQTGLIGYVQGKFFENSFFNHWVDVRSYIKTKEFLADYDNVFAEFKNSEELAKASKLWSYCYAHPQFLIDKNVYGFLYETEKYAYLFRITPEEKKIDQYNIFCFCYVKEWLYSHIEKAKEGIRFVDSRYNDKFRLEDGTKVKITFPSAENKEYVCRYVDQYHLEIGSVIYHICELAELSERNGLIIEAV